MEKVNVGQTLVVQIVVIEITLRKEMVHAEVQISVAPRGLLRTCRYQQNRLLQGPALQLQLCIVSSPPSLRHRSHTDHHGAHLRDFATSMQNRMGIICTG